MPVVGGARLVLGGNSVRDPSVGLLGTAAGPQVRGQPGPSRLGLHQQHRRPRPGRVGLPAPRELFRVPVRRGRARDRDPRGRLHRPRPVPLEVGFGAGSAGQHPDPARGRGVDPGPRRRRPPQPITQPRRRGHQRHRVPGRVVQQPNQLVDHVAALAVTAGVVVAERGGVGACPDTQLDPPPESTSQTAASSASRRGSSSAAAITPVPSRSVLVRAAIAASSTNGEGSSPSSAPPWCWATQNSSKPDASAATASSMVSWNTWPGSRSPATWLRYPNCTSPTVASVLRCGIVGAPGDEPGRAGPVFAPPTTCRFAPTPARGRCWSGPLCGELAGVEPSATGSRCGVHGRPRWVLAW